MTSNGSMTFSPPTDDWRQATPDEAATAGAAYLAFRRGATPAPFTTNIAVTGQVVTADVDLMRAAEDAVDQLGDGTLRAEVLKREAYGAADAPGVAQLVEFVVPVDGRKLVLHQAQVLVLARDVRTPVEDGGAFLYLISLTGTPDEVRSAAPDLQTFLRAIQLDETT